MGQPCRPQLRSYVDRSEGQGEVVMGRVMADHRPRRYDGDDSLVTRQAAGYYVQRHPDVISRNCEPVACDVRSRLPLYSLEAVCERVAELRKRRVA